MDHLHFQNITIVELGDGTYRNPSTAKGINTKEKFEIMNRVIKMQERMTWMHFPMLEVKTVNSGINTIINNMRLRRVSKSLKQINALSKEYSNYTDEQLKAKTLQFKERLQSSKTTLDKLLPEAYATVREASKRVECTQRMFKYLEQLSCTKVILLRCKRVKVKL